jgi:triphosphoribosyl-dephospho-CoA synthase
LERIVDYALKALLYEVAATPKPGLVDRSNNGAHDDMDFYTFLDSTVGLRHYFSAIVHYIKEQYKLSTRSIPIPKGAYLSGDALFTGLKDLGVQAEAEMKQVTKGINTHKGAIYALGLLVAAATETHIVDQSIKGDAIISKTAQRVTAYVGPTLHKEFENHAHTKAYGISQYKDYGMLGARGEAYSGFKTVRKFGLPMFEEALRDGLSVNDAMIHALMAIIIALEDSNVIGRHNVAVLKESQLKAHEILLAGGMKTVEGKRLIEAYDRWCITHRISHGGSADLVAVTVFMYWIKSN